jgi:hypothetical protein
MNDPVVVYLADRRDRFDPVGWYRLDCLCASLQTVSLFLPSLPVVVFHEDLQVQDEERLRLVLPRIQFSRVDFETHREHHVNRRPDGRVGLYGYCMMCRFFSGVVQAHPLVASHSHYMRLDDDNYFIGPVAAETIQAAITSDYVYSCAFEEDHQELYNFTKQFMLHEGLSLDGSPSYNRGGSPYTNFHISSLAMWRHPVVQRFVAAIETEQGCLRLGWTDSSIQFMIIALLGPQLGFKVRVDRRFNYRHNQHCVHDGPHTPYCRDGKNDKYPWGPPVCLGGPGWSSHAG